MVGRNPLPISRTQAPTQGPTQSPAQPPAGPPARTPAGAPAQTPAGNGIRALLVPPFVAILACVLAAQATATVGVLYMMHWFWILPLAFWWFCWRDPTWRATPRLMHATTATTLAFALNMTVGLMKSHADPVAVRSWNGCRHVLGFPIHAITPNENRGASVLLVQDGLPVLFLNWACWAGFAYLVLWPLKQTRKEMSVVMLLWAMFASLWGSGALFGSMD